jgi:hypothetical protein
MPTRLYFVLNCFSFTFITHHAYSDILFNGTIYTVLSMTF